MLGAFRDLTQDIQCTRVAFDCGLLERMVNLLTSITEEPNNDIAAIFCNIASLEDYDDTLLPIDLILLLLEYYKSQPAIILSTLDGILPVLNLDSINSYNDLMSILTAVMNYSQCVDMADQCFYILRLLINTASDIHIQAYEQVNLVSFIFNHLDSGSEIVKCDILDIIYHLAITTDLINPSDLCKELICCVKQSPSSIDHICGIFDRVSCELTHKPIIINSSLFENLLQVEITPLGADGILGVVDRTLKRKDKDLIVGRYFDDECIINLEPPSVYRSFVVHLLRDIMALNEKYQQPIENMSLDPVTREFLFRPCDPDSSKVEKNADIFIGNFYDEIYEVDDLSSDSNEIV